MLMSSKKKGDKGKVPCLCLVKHRCQKAYKQNGEDELIHKISLIVFLEGKKKG